MDDNTLDPYRSYELGIQLKKNHKSVEDLQKAKDYLSLAVKKHVPHAHNDLFDVMWLLDDKKSIDKLLPLIKPFAEEGDQAAQGRLARLYRDGKGVEKDLVQAAQWMMKAVNQYGWYNECFDIIWELESQDYDHYLMEVIRDAVQRSDSGALYRSALCCLYGRGASKNLNQAFDNLVKSIRCNYLPAITTISKCYIELNKAKKRSYSKKDFPISSSTSHELSRLSDINLLTAKPASIDATRKTIYEGDKTFVTSKRREFQSIEELDEITDGAFSITLGTAKFNCIFKKAIIKKLYVFLQGRHSSEHPLNQPEYSRWSYYSQLGCYTLTVSDPMNLLGYSLGWYWGTKNEDYRSYLAEICKYIANKFGIQKENIIFYGSSGGGTAAIHLSSLLEGSTAIALNPQTSVFERYDSASILQKKIQYDLWNDVFARDDIIHSIQKSSKIIYIVNSASDLDYIPFKNICDYLKFDIRYGLNIKNNMIAWVYNSNFWIPHNVFETKALMQSIDYLTGSTKRKLDNDKYLYLILSELWNEEYLLKNELHKLEGGGRKT